MLQGIHSANKAIGHLSWHFSVNPRTAVSSRSTQPSAMQLSALSSDSLLCIFAEIDLLDLLCTVPLVCSTWSTLQPLACKQRHQLTLVFAPSQQQFRRPQQLCPSRFDRTSAQWLMDCLQRINHLANYHHYSTSESFDEQVFLLQHWSPTLTSLTLHSSLGTTRLAPAVKATAIEALGRLLAAVNALPSLRFLALHSQLDFPRMDLPIFGQLQKIDTLNVRSSRSCKVLAESLLKFALANPNLDELGIFLGPNHADECMPLLSNDQLVSKIRHLHFDHDHTAPFAYLVQRCTNLQQVHLCSVLQTLCERIHLLAQLPQLVELRLTIVEPRVGSGVRRAWTYQYFQTFFFPEDTFFERRYGQLRPNQPPVDESKRHRPPSVQLTSVRRFSLTVHAYNIKHSSFIKLLNLAWVLPNVRQVDFIIGKVCGNCQWNHIDAYSCTVGMIRTMGQISSLEYVHGESADDPSIEALRATLRAE